MITSSCSPKATCPTGSPGSSDPDRVLLAPTLRGSGASSAISAAASGERLQGVSRRPGKDELPGGFELARSALSNYDSEYAAARPRKKSDIPQQMMPRQSAPATPDPHAAALSRVQPRNPGGDEHELRGRTPSFAEGDGSDGHHGGGIAGGLGADGGPVPGGERGAEGEGAGRCLRLSHAYGRPPLPRRAQCEAAAGGCDRGRLSSVAEAHRHVAQRRGAALDLWRRTIAALLDAHGAIRQPSRARRRGGRYRASTDAELQAARTALGVRGIRFNRRPGRRDDHRDARAAVASASHDARLARADPHAGDQIAAARRSAATRLPSPIVFDHLGRMPQPAGIDHPAFAVVIEAARQGRAPG